MQLSDLEYFKALAERLNYTKAAQALFISQSSLSKTISKLEGSLGIALFERDTHGVELTPAGNSLYKDVVEILDQYQQAVGRARKLSKTRLPLLHVGGHLANPRIYSLIESARTQTQGGATIIVDANHVGSIERRPGLNDPYEEALAGINDVNILYTSSKLRESELVVLPLYEEPLSVFVSSSSPLAGRHGLGLRDLEGLTHVTTTTYYTFGWAIEDLLAKEGVAANFKRRVVDSMADLLLNRSDSEVYVMARSMVELAPPQEMSRLTPVPLVDGSTVTVSATYLPSKRSGVLDRFVETLQSIAAKM